MFSASSGKMVIVTCILIQIAEIEENVILKTSEARCNRIYYVPSIMQLKRSHN